MAVDNILEAKPVRSKGSASEQAFRFSAIGALAFETVLIVAVLIALVVYTDGASFVNSLLSAETIFSIKLTLITVSLSTFLSMLLAIPAAYALSNYRVPFSSVIDTLLDLPIVLPPVAAGLALLVLFGF